MGAVTQLLTVNFRLLIHTRVFIILGFFPVACPAGALRDYGDEPPPPYQAHEGYECPPPYSPPQYPGPQEVDVGGHATDTNPVAPGPVTMSDPPPPDFMNRAIFVTICCFWPTGIFAIMKASESRKACARGDFLNARDNAKSSRQLSNISIMIGVVLMLVTIVVVGLYWFFIIIPNLSSGPDRYR